MISRIFNSKTALLYLVAIAMPLSFAAWMALLNNFVVEKAHFNGSEIGILQSVREIPGLMSFSVVLVLLLVSQQRLTYISLILLGVGTLITGYLHSTMGLYFATIVMSAGFHYLQTLNQSLNLQWIPKHQTPIILGRLSSAQAFARLSVFIFIYVFMGYFTFTYKTVYTLFGGITILLGIIAWIGFKKFNEGALQEKKLMLTKRYWLFYLLTFFGGARRQIFVVFAAFLLVEKFGVSIHHMVVLLFANAILNIYLAPKVGRLISRFGEAVILKLEYIGLFIIFMSYAYVSHVQIAYVLYLLDSLLFAMSFSLATYFQKIADPKDISTNSAISGTINHIAAVFLPFILGLVWLKSPYMVFIIGAGIAAISFILVFLIPRNPVQGYETILSNKEILK